MKLDDRNQIGIVIHCYDYNTTHCILEVLSNDVPKEVHFFYIGKTPQVDFGDHIQMNFVENKFYVYRGNSRLSFRITPSPFPGGLLWELISDRLNDEDSK